MLNKDE